MTFVEALEFFMLRRSKMPVINMTGLNTQVAPMDAIESILVDHQGGFINHVEALSIINAIVCEWRQ